jgi:hypothetical protein
VEVVPGMLRTIPACGHVSNRCPYCGGTLDQLIAASIVGIRIQFHSLLSVRSVKSLVNVILSVYSSSGAIEFAELERRLRGIRASTGNGSRLPALLELLAHGGRLNAYLVSAGGLERGRPGRKRSMHLSVTDLLVRGIQI